MSTYDPNFIPVKHYALVGQKAIITCNDKILILKRSKKAGGTNLWSVPGGGLEAGENPLESIVREIKEETKLHVSDLSPFTLRSYMHKKDFIVIIGYLGNTKTDKPKLNWENTAYKWVSKKYALKEKLSEDARYIIDRLNK